MVRNGFNHSDVKKLRWGESIPKFREDNYDYEVRDRAAYYCVILQQQSDPAILPPSIQPPHLSVSGLEVALITSMNEPFDISQIPSAQTVDELLKAVDQIVDKKTKKFYTRTMHD